MRYSFVIYFSTCSLFSCGVIAPSKVHTEFVRVKIKTSMEDCVDPDLQRISENTQLTMCNGEVARGKLANCQSDGQENCLTTARYLSIKKTNIASSSIRRGVKIGGVEGTFPSANSPLKKSRSTLRTLDNYKTISGTSEKFLYWDNVGSSHEITVKKSTTLDIATQSMSAQEVDILYASITINGDSNLVAANIKDGIEIYGVTGTSDFDYLDPWNLRAGVSVGTVAGKMKMACKNLADISKWDLPALASVTNVNTAGNPTNGDGIANWWDTIDDYNFDGTQAPSDNPWSSEIYACDGNDFSVGGKDSGNVPGFCNDAADECVKFDRISNTYWSEGLGTYNWADAARKCESLNTDNFGNFNSGWRLPTQKEFMTAAIHGFAFLKDVNFIPNMHTYFWTSTSESGAAHRNTAAVAHKFRPSNSFDASAGVTKSSLLEVSCIRWEAP